MWHMERLADSYMHDLPAILIYFLIIKYFRCFGVKTLNETMAHSMERRIHMQKKQENNSLFIHLLRFVQGILIGLGAVLPGISGGVLCVVFGIYKPVMELLSNPFRHFKTHVPKLLPVVIGAMAGFLGIARLLSFFLIKYPSQSVCLFAGLIIGTLPSLFREAESKGTSKNAHAALFISMTVTVVLLCALNALTVKVTPGFFWYCFCGFCLALSVIAPGMSFSTLLMPLGLYTPFVDGIGRLDMGVLLPAGLGALLTVFLLSKAIGFLFEHHHATAFHAIIGIVIAATILIVPLDNLTSSGYGFFTNGGCMGFGIVTALLLAKWNQGMEARSRSSEP